MGTIKRNNPGKGFLKNNLPVFFIDKCYSRTLKRKTNNNKKDDPCYVFKSTDNTPALLEHVY